jgi:Mg/Co/Ni transporter MgtE
MSPRAAWRLESLGFADVSDYAPGKQDWAQGGLPLEGRLAGRPTTGSVARTDAPVCLPAEKVGEARDRAMFQGIDACVVVNEARVVLGMLRGDALAGDPEAAAVDAMRTGPSTFRANIDIVDMAQYLTEHDLPNAPITTPEGVLLGLLVREDALRAAAEAHRRHSHE